MINENLQWTQLDPLVFRKLEVTVFGVAFAVTGGYSVLKFVLALLFLQSCLLVLFGC